MLLDITQPFRPESILTKRGNQEALDAVTVTHISSIAAPLTHPISANQSSKYTFPCIIIGVSPSTR
jgi:hypothetical protein